MSELEQQKQRLYRYLNSKINNRIELLSKDLNPNWPLLDLCCDHGYIGLWAWCNDRCSSVRFVDCVASIINSLEVRLKSFASVGNFQFECRDASTISLPPSPTNIIIAGVGGRQVIKCLEAYKLHLKDEPFVLVCSAETSWWPLKSYMMSNFPQEKLDIYEEEDVKHKPVVVYKHSGRS